MNVDYPKDINKLFKYLQDEVSNNYLQIDRDSSKLKNILDRMFELNAFAINIKEEDGGYNFNRIQKYFFFKSIATISSCLMLVQAQCQSSISKIYNHSNYDFKKKWLKSAYQGRCKIGVAMSHLKILKPLVVGVEYKDYFLVNGKVHFFTGYNIFDYMILGFTANNSEYLALVSADDKQWYNIQYHDLLIAKSTNTISFSLKNYMVDKASIFHIQPIGTHMANVGRNLVGLISALIAMAFKSLNLLISSQQYNSRETTYSKLKIFCTKVQDKLEKMEEDIISDNPVMSFTIIRVELIMLINNCILIAEQLYKGSAMIKTHPLNWLKHEVLLTKSIAANDDILDFMLNKVISDN